MIKTKKILSIVLILVMAFSMTINVDALSTKTGSYNISINGKKITDTTAGKKLDGLVFVGLRAVSKSAGISATWDAKKNVMTIMNGKLNILVTADSSKITVNKKVFLLNAKARLVDNKLYVPTGFFTKNTGFSIGVNKDNIAIKTIAVGKPTPTTPKPTVKPTVKPSVKPTATPKPTVKPTIKPTLAPTEAPEPTIQIGPGTGGVVTPTPNTPTQGAITPTPDARNTVSEISSGVEGGIFYIGIKADQEINMSNYTATDPAAIVFDIAGAKLGVEERNVSVYNDFCTTMSYYLAKDKKNVVRVKLLTKKTTNYQMVFSDDKKSVRINFKNDLKGISVTQKGADEIVRFSGIPFADWKMTYEKLDNKLVFTADRAVNAGSAIESMSKLAKRIVVFAPADGKITIEMYLIDGLFYKSKNVTNEMELTLSESPFSFMTYTKYGTTGIAEMSFGKNRMPVCNLDRVNGTYSVSAKGNFDKLIANVAKYDNLIGGYQISVSPSGVDKITTVTFRILPTTDPEIISNDGGTIKIRFLKHATLPSQLTIVIDAGHGGADSGAVGYINGATIYEKKVNLDVALRLDRILRENGFNTLLTRKTDVTLDLMSRGPTANKINADFFISIHHNSAASATANGLSTLYKLYDVSDLRPITNKTIASLFQKNILRDLQRKDIGISLRPELAVLRTTEMPSLLMELGFLQNKSDLAQIIKYQYRETAARSLAVSIIEYFNNYQGSRLEMDTVAILNRPMYADTWQPYQDTVSPPPAYIPGMEKVTITPSVTPVIGPTVTPGDTNVIPSVTVTPTPTTIPTPTPDAIVIPAAAN